MRAERPGVYLAGAFQVSGLSISLRSRIVRAYAERILRAARRAFGADTAPNASTTAQEALAPRRSSQRSAFRANDETGT